MNLIKRIWNNPAALAILLLGSLCIFSMVMDDLTKANLRRTIAAQQQLIDSQGKLSASSERERYSEMQLLSGVSCLVTAEVFADQMHKEGHLNSAMLWTNIATRYNQEVAPGCRKLNLDIHAQEFAE